MIYLFLLCMFGDRDPVGVAVVFRYFVDPNMVEAVWIGIISRLAPEEMWKHITPFPAFASKQPPLSYHAST
jgi:hypothetical protein